MTPLRLGILVCLIAAANPAAAQDEDGLIFGARFKGGPYQNDIYVNNTCQGTHTVQASFQGGNWYRITGQNPVRVAQGQTEYVTAFLDLGRAPLGKLTGTVTLTCLDCSAPTCTQSKRTIPVSVFVLDGNPTFGGPMQAIDQKFGGLVNGQPVDLCDVLKNILNDLEKTNFGANRGKRIIARLREKYVTGDCSGDMTFVSTREVTDGSASGRVREEKDKASEQPNIDNAAYVRDRGTEEIFVGIDQRASTILCARQEPEKYFIYTYKGKLGVANKTEIIHSLIHEGLHATNQGAYSVPDKDGNTNVSWEEENDAFEAGDEACEALGVPVTGERPGEGYHGVKHNPNYPKMK